MTRGAALIALLLSVPAQSAQEDPSSGGVGARPSLLAERADDVERAVARGLAYLARQQQKNGGFTGDAGHKQMDDYLVLDSAERQAKDGDAHAGVTALAGLAFLADGHVPGRGEYSEQIGRIIDCIVEHQDDFGYLADQNTRMYSHAFATLFLSQVYGMAADRKGKVDEALRRAVKLIEDTQNDYGGWRYSPFTVEVDLSVTVCQVQALRAARDAGVHVNADCIDRVIAYVKKSRIDDGPDEGAFYYKIYGSAARTKTSFAINAAAVTSLHSAGCYDASLYGNALAFLEREYPDVSKHYGDHFYFWYGNYYAAQALHFEGGHRWERYWRRLRDDLLARQNEDGSWTNTVGPGNNFATAVACILLRLPAEYLPIFGR